MAARVEHGVEVFLLGTVEANGLVELSIRSRVRLEPAREVSPEFVALRIERRAAAFRGCEGDLDAGVLENTSRSCRLFRPVSPSWSLDVITISTFMAASIGYVV
jgi:hypothetical protein